MFETVVLALDGSSLAEQALAPAAAIARRSGARLRLLHVEIAGGHSDAAERLGALADQLDQPCEVAIVDGDWVAEAIAEAADQPDTLLCLTSHGAGGLRRALLGSVAEDVLRLHAHPILLVGPHGSEGPPIDPGARLLICTDGSAVADTIVPVAQAWCAAFGLAPWVVTVVDPEVVAGTDRSDVVESGHVERIARQLGADDGRGGWDVLHDSQPARALAEAARALPAALLTLATHGKTGLARVTMGSVASAVLREAPCPVLVLRPSGLEDG
jgi:nucleotide-binding universal stress UspA family protein